MAVVLPARWLISTIRRLYGRTAKGRRARRRRPTEPVDCEGPQKSALDGIQSAYLLSLFLSAPRHSTGPAGASGGLRQARIINDRQSIPGRLPRVKFITVTLMSQHLSQWLLLVPCLLLSGVSLGQVSEENASVRIEQQTNQAAKPESPPDLAEAAADIVKRTNDFSAMPSERAELPGARRSGQQDRATDRWGSLQHRAR